MRIKNLFKELKSVKMTETEKSLIRARLVDLSGFQTAKPTVDKYRSPYTTWSFSTNFRSVGAGVFILLLASTGVSFAAEQTLPGDILYPVKVNVNEEVRGALTISNTNKMDWEKERVVRRVVETETLLKTNKFTPKRKAQAETALKTQMATFAAAAAETSAKDPNAVIAATAELEPALKVHQEVISNLATDITVDVNATDTENILDTVALGITAASQQETVAIDVAVDKNPDTLVALTDDKITSAMNAIDTSAPEKEIVAADAAAKADAEAAKETESTTKIDEKTDDTTNTPSETKPTEVQTKELPPVPADTKSDSKTDTKTDAKVDVKADAKIVPSLMSATDTAPAPTPALDPKEVLATAKEKLRQAKILREKGDLKGALTLAQDAYKDMVALKLQTKLAAKKAAEDAKSAPQTESKTETKSEVKGEVKGAQTETAPTIETSPKTDLKVETTTPLSTILKN